MELEELNPELFNWETYEYDFGHRLDCYWNQYPEIFQFEQLCVYGLFSYLFGGVGS